MAGDEPVPPSPTVGVIGCGSIGSVLARGFGGLEYDVVVNDVDDAAAAALPYPARSKPALAEEADVIVVAVPTPTTDDGGDVSAVAAVLEAIQQTDATVVIRSTMPPGTTMHLAGRFELPLVYSPEFLRDRSTVEDFFDVDRAVLAGPEPQRMAARKLLTHERRSVGAWFETGDYIDAELAKEAHNALFATKVSFANQLRAIAERAGADPERLMDIVIADERNTGSHLDPMLGPYGGKCLPKDTRALQLFARDAQVPTPLLDGTITMNDIANNTYEHLSINGTWPDIEIAGD